MTIPQLPKNFERRLAELEQQVERLAASRRLIAATIGSGGLTVTAGGVIEVTDVDGNVLVRIGNSAIAVYAGDGDTLWTSTAATIGSTPPDPSSTLVSSVGSWTTIVNWSWPQTAQHVRAGCIVTPPGGQTCDVRLVDQSGTAPTGQVGIVSGLAGDDVGVVLDADLAIPSGRNYHTVQLQARVSGGTAAVYPLAASWTE